MDLDNNKVYWATNGTWENSANPATNTNGFSINADTYQFILHGYQSTSEANFGNPSFSISSGNSDDNGYGNFEYSVPSGYLALCTQNLATELSPTIDDGSAYFQTALWSGTGASLQITNNGNSDLQPDFFWGKSRSNGSGHTLIDSSRGLTKYLVSNDTAGDTTNSTTITSFNTDGFTLGTDSSTSINYSGRTYVGWQWKANGGTTSSNTDGSITSTVQANTTAGFSVVTYTGTGANATIGHGLGKIPAMTIHKRRDSSSGWLVYHQGYGATKYLQLNSTDATTTASFAWNNTEPTSSVISMGTAGGNNSSGGTYVAYCFAEIEGYSKFGSYTGNGSSDGTFVYTGFRPAWVIVKCSSSSQSGAAHWILYDVKRNTFNVVDELLYANLSNNESTNDSSRPMDILSNGFKLRGSGSGSNSSGATYIYMAFAENPFVTSGATPVTAR
jgi:hypothetical protein